MPRLSWRFRAPQTGRRLLPGPKASCCCICRAAHQPKICSTSSPRHQMGWAANSSRFLRAPGDRSLRAFAPHCPLDAQVGRRSQRVPQRRLPQEPADVYRLRRESARRRVSRIRPAEHGIRLFLSPTRAAKGITDIRVPAMPFGLGRGARKPVRMAAFWDGVSIRSVPSARRLSIILPTSSGNHRSCAASRASPTWISSAA